MQTQALLISECHFKEMSPVVGNIDYEFLVPFIRQATDIDISEHTGEALLTRLAQGIIDADLNANEVILLERYIQPTLVAFTMFRGMNFLGIKPDNSGLVKRNSENGAAIELNESSFLADTQKNVADSYGQRLKDYLNNNADLYPQYKTEMEGQIKPSDTPSAHGGLWIGISNKNCNTL